MQVIRREEVFGAPLKRSSIMNELSEGDILVFCVLKPRRAIVSLYTVKSNVYLGKNDLWGKNRYPVRVKIKALKKFKKPVPIVSIFGGNINENITVEPLLIDVYIQKIVEPQKSKVLNLLKNHE